MISFFTKPRTLSLVAFSWGVSFKYSPGDTFRGQERPWRIQVMRHFVRKDELTLRKSRIADTLFWVNHNPFAAWSKGAAATRFTLPANLADIKTALSRKVQTA